MIQKTFHAYEFNGQSATTLLETAQGKLSRDFLLKQACEDANWYRDEVKTRPGHAYMLVITNGAGEFYGSNVNNDYFNEGRGIWHGFDVPPGQPTSYQMKGGLKEFHRTYRSLGGVYRRHRNGTKKNPATGKNYEKEGNICCERYNEDLHRGEAVLELPEDKWADVIQKVSAGDPVCWSMGAGVPFDICSACLNKAKTRKDYCQHMKHQAGRTLSDGNKIFVINDETYYHDISEVGTNPAMKIAFTLEKVAAGEACGPMELSSDGLWLPLHVVQQMDANHGRRYGLLLKMAAAEARLRAQGADKHIDDLADTFDVSDEGCAEAADRCRGIPLDQLFSQLASQKILLPPKVFTAIVIRRGQDNGLLNRWPDAMPSMLKDIFTRIAAQPQLLEEVVGDGCYRPQACRCCGRPVLPPSLEERFSIDPDAVRHRTITVIVRGGERPRGLAEKQASACTEPEKRMAQAAALEYAKYQLSFAAALDGGTEMADVMVAANKAQVERT